MEFFAVESGAFLVSRLSLVCCLDVVSEERDKALLFLFLVRLLCRGAGAAVEAAVLGSVCRIAFHYGFNGMAEFSVLDRGLFDNVVVDAGYSFCPAYVFNGPLSFELGAKVCLRC